MYFGIIKAKLSCLIVKQSPQFRSRPISHRLCNNGNRNSLREEMKARIVWVMDDADLYHKSTDTPTKTNSSQNNPLAEFHFPCYKTRDLKFPNSRQSIKLLLFVTPDTSSTIPTPSRKKFASRIGTKCNRNNYYKQIVLRMTNT
jgi:hypothetical protein